MNDSLSGPQGLREKPKLIFILLGVTVVLALLTIAFTFGMHLSSFVQQEASTEKPVTQNDTLNTETDTPSPDEIDDEDVPTPTNGDGLSVTWYAVDKQEERDFNFYLRERWEEQQGTINDFRPTNRYTAKIIGEIPGGETYEGRYLVQANVSTDAEIGGEMGTTFYLLEEQKSDRGAIVLNRYTVHEPFFSPLAYSQTEFLEAYASDQLIVSDTKVSGMDAPPVLSVGEEKFIFMGIGGIVADKTMVMNAYPPTVFANENVASSYAYALSIYTRQENSVLDGSPNDLFTILPNGRTVWYAIDLPVWDETGENIQTPSLVWNDKDEVAEYMRGAIGGCGFAYSTNVVTEKPSLATAGYVKDKPSELVYIPADYGDTLLTNDYNNWSSLQKAQAENVDTSITAFSKGKPIFYMKDGLDRWVKFTRSDVIPPGECGKPVIYLYPETTTDLTVTLAPQGGFTKTEPAYGNGWHVTAHPDGSLINHADQQTYPYLFWEGRGGLYSEPRNFWVVKRDEVHTFLTTTLAKLGLNEKETADFMEFWEPRMQAAPYYKIGFHGTSAMNQIAPLSISQKPHMLLRILMDYSELQSPIAANPPQLPATPVRKGFSVIEWGGVIR